MSEQHEDDQTKIIRLLSEEVEGWRKMATAMMNDNHLITSDNRSLSRQLRVCWRQFERLAQRVHKLEDSQNGNGSQVKA